MKIQKNANGSEQETYYRYDYKPGLESSAAPESHDALGNIGRLGSVALVAFSIITFGSSILLPYMVKAPTSLSEPSRSKFTPRPPPSLSKSVQAFLMRATLLQPDLVTTWLVSNLAFALILIWAPFVRSLAFATTLVALAGVPWAISSWAPFAEMGVEINRLASDDISSDESANVIYPTGNIRGGYAALRPSMDADADSAIEMQQHNRTYSDGVLRLNHDDADDAQASTGELAGVYLGVLNVYTTLPQFVGTLVSWIVFTVLEPGKDDVTDEDPDHQKWLDVKKNAPNAISICLFVGACCAVVAAEATRRLMKLTR